MSMTSSRSVANSPGIWSQKVIVTHFGAVSCLFWASSLKCLISRFVSLGTTLLTTTLALVLKQPTTNVMYITV